jgi:hypothetical protein
MAQNRISKLVQDACRVKLTCAKCAHRATIGLDALEGMAARRDDINHWRARFKCAKCGEPNPYMALVPTSCTPDRAEMVRHELADGVRPATFGDG